MNIKEYLGEMKTLIDNTLDRYIPADTVYPPDIYKSIRYSLFAGGKRLRPILVIASAETVGGNREDVLPFACAIEMIHTYTLIHDDLPALDNDDLRRGKPTNHKEFGEAIAILAGDALLTMAFQIMSEPSAFSLKSSTLILKSIHEIAKAVGVSGTIGGQVVDIQATGKKLDIPTLEYIHTHKTGEMILSAVRVGAILSGCEDDELHALTCYGENIGLAFQVMDDILDVEGESEIMGKTRGSDEKMRKVTYPSVFGLSESKKIASRLIENSIQSMEMFGERGEILKDISEYIIARRF
ncbi:MAG: polyprenyl synthetase family protein [Nitrospinae bacterium]|nr:polyprenyl synthetase family protein [Nitrospinota bacterium]